MGDWRGYQRETPPLEGLHPPLRSKNRRPPPGSWQPTVPAWEKKFCYSTCSIPWRKLLETKKLMCFFKNVAQWNDSAGEEAFKNAKARFWAEMNGLRCDISLPDPDIYIDKIDWNCTIDPELVSDLDQPPPPPDLEEEGKSRHLRCGWDLYLSADKPIMSNGWGNELIQPTGWEDAEEPVKASGWGDIDQPIKPSGWGDAEEQIKPTGWGDAEERVNYCYNHGNSNTWRCSQWENGPVEKNSWEDKAAGTFSSWGTWDTKIEKEDFRDGTNGWPSQSWNYCSRKRIGANPYMSRYKTSRYQHGGDVYRAEDNVQKNFRGRKRVNFHSDSPEADRRAPASWQWNSMHSCVPRNHHHDGKVGNGWNEQVS